MPAKSFYLKLIRLTDKKRAAQLGSPRSENTVSQQCIIQVHRDIDHNPA